MRLIDADKIEYMWKQDINGNFHDGVTLESIVDKTPTENVNDLIVKELEKVRAKIIKKANSGQWSEPTIYGTQKAVFIIDNELTELKGENK